MYMIYIYMYKTHIYIWYMYTVIRTSSGWIWWWPHVVTSVDWGNHHLKWLQILARYHGGCELTIWLVVSNMFYFPFHIWDNPSHWLRFFKMVIAPPTSKWEYQGISIGRICSSTQPSNRWVVQPFGILGIWIFHGQLGIEIWTGNEHQLYGFL